VLAKIEACKSRFHFSFIAHIFYNRYGIVHFASVLWQRASTSAWDLGVDTPKPSEAVEATKFVQTAECSIKAAEAIEYTAGAVEGRSYRQAFEVHVVWLSELKEGLSCVEQRSEKMRLAKEHKP
jgi:hypothetical protein